MHVIASLWLPVLLSAVGVFIASSIIHMASPWHRDDYPRMANEDAVMDAMRPLALPPGDYFFPRPGSMAEMKSEAHLARVAKGPVVLMTVMPNGIMPMGKTFVQWFIYLLVVGLLAAAVVGVIVPAGAPHGVVFHEVALVSFAGYALALWQLSIWYRRSWSITMKSTVDAVIYSAITGAIFMWCWPR